MSVGRNANPTIMSDPHQSHTSKLIRALGPLDATCIVIGAIIGVGIFFTPSRVAELSGSANMALLTWVIGGVIALLGALTFAELGRLYPRTGAQYVILRDAFGPLAGFLFVFCNATAVQAGSIAIIGVVCAQNVGVSVWSHPLGPAAQTTMAAGLIIGLTVANCIGVRWGSRIQNVTVFAKVATLIAISILAAFFDGDVAPVSAQPVVTAASHLGPLAGISAALVPVLFSYGGWQQALWIAGEVRKPKRDVPLAIVAGVLIVILVYLLANWAYLTLLDVHQVSESETLAADAVAVFWPSIGRRLVAGAVAVSAFGVLNTQLLTGPRLIYGMAVDGRFFKLFARVSAKCSTPIPAIVLLAVVPIGLLLAAGENRVNRILNGAVLIDGVFFMFTGLSLLVLRRKRRALDLPVRVPGYSLVPLFFVAGEFIVVVGAFCDPAVRAAAHLAVAWIAGATICFVLFFRRVDDGRRANENG
ncbi:MAG: amino acid permease [Planctomycetes bacterium]|nr:amino acid permease [Planctomycetota bacterium]MBI3835230.1 amino acid permease [Planctomycetota bacterium]